MNKQLALAAVKAHKPKRGRGRPKVAPDKQKGHIPRPDFSSRHPLHITLSVVPGLGSLRRGGVYAEVEAALSRGKQREGFRVVHFSVQANHLHLVVEAASRLHLGRGMQILNILLARAINRALGRRSGQVFAERYHARVLKTPTEVKVVLDYVYKNAHKHSLELGGSRGSYVDPCSSGAWFDGWKYSIGEMAILQKRRREPPVAAATVWLLTTGWRKLGLLTFWRAQGKS